jgi:quinol monooxygenase YgiN
MVTVIWDMRVKSDAAEMGLAIIQRIWVDMCTLFHGYVGHRLFADADQSGHFVVVSDWASRDDADRSLRQYADAETVRQLQPLLTEARVRTVLSEVR